MVKVVDDSAMSWKEHINYCKAYQSQGSTKQYVFIVSCRPRSLEVPISVSAKLCLEPKKSSLIFLEDEEKLDFLTTSLQMVLNDSSLYTHKARKEILDNFVGFDGAMKKHIFIGSYLGWAHVELENQLERSSQLNGLPSKNKNLERTFQHESFYFNDVFNFSFLLRACFRLNSGIFWLSSLSECNLYLNSSDWTTLKIIQNDTDSEPIPWELSVENQLFHFCGGVWVLN